MKLHYKKEGFLLENKFIVNVPVATVWTSYDSARELDKDAVTNPSNIEAWLESLTYETRLELCNANLVQTQALYGEEVLVIEEKEGWASVIVLNQPSSKDERGYPGWVPRDQLIESTPNRNLDEGPIAVVTSKKATLEGENHDPLLEVSYQTMLPVLEEGEFVKVQLPAGSGFLKSTDVKIYPSLSEKRKGNGKDIVVDGEQFLNLPYLWGGMSSYGYDCSGFSYNMCKANGYIIPRDAHDQAKAGKSVEVSDIQPGDLLFFAYEEGKGSIHHVGIYYGNGKLLHSPNTGKVIEIIPLEGTIYEKELCAARRYW
ncbi:NlpC/P60 family protein [Cytobacillus sp. FJAT-54145]|uniref:NlpC/P60 family protein n=1 Tax=Cytobacillus spartinae TaxID=3299023 RepID=A0ABW6KBN4_9BACI